MGWKTSVYAPLNFRIYENKFLHIRKKYFCIYEKIFLYIRKFPSVYTLWNARIYDVIFPRYLHSKAPRLQVYLRAGRLGF